MNFAGLGFPVYYETRFDFGILFVLIERQFSVCTSQNLWDIGFLYVPVGHYRVLYLGSWTTNKFLRVRLPQPFPPESPSPQFPLTDQ